MLAYFDRPGTSNGPTEAVNGRLEHLRGTALGFRNLTNYITAASSTPAASDPDYTLFCGELVNRVSGGAQQGGHCEPDAGSILGEPVHPERQFSALQLAIGRGARPNCECLGEAAHERRLILIGQVQ